VRVFKPNGGTLMTEEMSMIETEAMELYLESLLEDHERIPEEDVIIKPIKVAV
jgi:predicted RNase H-like HicB family nuclease